MFHRGFQFWRHSEMDQFRAIIRLINFVIGYMLYLVLYSMSLLEHLLYLMPGIFTGCASCMSADFSWRRHSEIQLYKIVTRILWWSASPFHFNTLSALLEFIVADSSVQKMSPENGSNLLESDAANVSFKETELTLGLPGESRGLALIEKTSGKRGFLETVDLNLGRSSNVDSDHNKYSGESETDVPNTAKPPAAKAQVVGWPPVRAYRKNAMKSCKYVKVAVDGAPYLRKVDLEMYNSYQQLLNALQDMFSCFSFTIRNYLNERTIMEQEVNNGVEYVPTYEDKDGDWMMLGDVPWKMFVESCKRLRLMKSSEATGFAPRTPSKCSSSS